MNSAISALDLHRKFNMSLLPGALFLLLATACYCTREFAELGTWYNGSVIDGDITTLMFDLDLAMENKTAEVIMSGWYPMHTDIMRHDMDPSIPSLLSFSLPPSLPPSLSLSLFLSLSLSPSPPLSPSP